jgi:adenosylcobinamide kinase/adenosylcobinamide-phosphate guanylyltransferase
MKTLVLGGIRSGKSQLAETIAAESAGVAYIATATASDGEMKQRILSHQARRPAAWRDHEEPIHLVQAMQINAIEDGCLLVDCLSLWVSNLLFDEDKSLLETEITSLLEFLPDCPGEVIFVSNESSMGVIPMGELSRQYCDVLGLLHQDVARLSDRVILTIAGLPHYLKGVQD